MKVTIDDIRERLSEIRPPGLSGNLVELGMVHDVRCEGGRVTLHLVRGPLTPETLRATATEIQRAVGAFEGVSDVDIHVIAPAAPGAAPGPPEPLSGVASIVAVSSTKGGVGKSTVAVNLACALATQGHRTGLLDADVYGPSLPTMLGLSGRPEVAEGQRVRPLEKHGIKLMSMGFFLDENTPVIWRGALVTGLIRQFLRDVDWGDLDVLVIDLPPGTGDAQLTLVQQVPLTGGVIVTTPQAVSLLDVERGIGMFEQVNTPVLGIIENMSEFECPKCHRREAIFGEGGGERIAHRFDVPLLAQIPLIPEVRAAGDEGTPIVIAQPEHPVAKVFQGMSRRIAEELAAAREETPVPRIVG